MPKQDTPVPEKQQVRTYISPELDYIFYEQKDGALPRNKIPEYGTPHPNTTGFPHHVLVYVAPVSEEEPHWSRWYYAARREDQDKYNFELYGDTHLKRTYYIPRHEYLSNGDEGDDYDPPTKGDADSEFSGFTFSAENVSRVPDKVLDSYFVLVERWYVDEDERIGQSDRGTARGEEGSITSLGSSATATPPGGIIVSRNSTLTEEKLWRNTTERLALRIGINAETERDQLGYRETEKRILSTEEPQSSSESQFSKSLVLTDADGVDRVWTAARTTRTSEPATGSMWVNFLGGGIATLTYSLVSDDTAADEGFLIIDSKVTPLGGGDAMKVTTTLPGYPTLTEYKYDSALDSMVEITKDVCAPSTAGSYTPGSITEVQPVDKWRSICVTSTVPSLTEVETLPGAFQFRFPPVISSVNLTWGYAYAYAGSSMDWDFDMALHYDLQEAYSGTFEGRIQRHVTKNPSTVTSQYTSSFVNFKPESHTVALMSAAAYASPSSVWAKVISRSWTTPLALHGNIVLQMPAALVPPGTVVAPEGQISEINGVTQVTFSATDPSGIPAAGTWMTVGTSTRRLRLGYYEVMVKQIKSPG